MEILIYVSQYSKNVRKKQFFFSSGDVADDHLLFRMLWDHKEVAMHAQYGE